MLALYYAGIFMLIWHPRCRAWCLVVLLPCNEERNWALPGGFVDNKEINHGTPDYLTAACREAKEEVLGRKPPQNKLTFIGDSMETTKAGQTIIGNTFCLYLADIEMGNIQQLVGTWNVNRQVPEEGHG